MSERDVSRVLSLLAAGIGVLIVLGITWLVTSEPIDPPPAAAPTTPTTPVFESTTTSVAPTEPTTTTTEPLETTTTTLTEQQANYLAAVSAVLVITEQEAANIESASTTWDTDKDSLEPGPRSRLWRVTQGVFGVAIVRLEELQADLEAVEVPADVENHDAIIEQLTLVTVYAEEALEGLKLPRGSEEVDGTIRLEAITNMNDALDTLRALITG